MNLLAGIRWNRCIPRLFVFMLTLVAGTLSMGQLAWPADTTPEPTPAPEIQQLLHQLDASDSYTRQLAFLQLEATRDPAAVPVVRDHLKSRNAEIRALSVRALAAIEGAKSVPTLTSYLRDRSPRVRLETILALEPLRDPSVTPLLIERLRDHSPEVRIAAVDVVSRLRDPQAQQAILTRWKLERHRDVRRVLEDAVKRLGSS